MFFCILFIIIVMILLIKIRVELKFKNNFKIIVRIGPFVIINKEINKKNNNKKSTKILNKIKLFDKEKLICRLIKILFKLVKKFKIIVADVNIFISNKDYIKGGYYIGAIETLTYFGKNFCNDINVHFSYKQQVKDLDITFRTVIEFKLYNTLIIFIEMSILILEIIKKGRYNNGNTSNRKFNSNCNVIN